MGAYASSFQTTANGGKLVSQFSNPTKPNWITAHAAVTELAVVEVERLWDRFLQLGGDKDGIITAENLQQHPAYVNNIFVKNMLHTMRSPDYTISFQTFVNAMKWCEAAELEDKLKAIFSLINSGKPVPKDLFVKVLKRTYDREDEESCKHIADLFFQQMDDKNQGFIEEEQFVRFISGMPRQTIDMVLQFTIIPPEVGEEGNRNYSAATTRRSMAPSTATSTGKVAVSDATLYDLAGKMVRRDWYILANKLGFTSQEITEFEQDHSHSVQDQVFEMLKAWKAREAANATNRNLELALKDSGMTDIAAEVRQ